MKKNMVRILAFVLVLILALGIIPLGALADGSIDHYKVYTDKTSVKYDADGNVDGGFHYPQQADILVGASGATIKTSSYDKYTALEGKLYDLDQFYIVSTNDKGVKTGTAAGHTVTIPGYPTDTAKQAEWESKYTYIDVVYTGHQHKLSYWYSDNTTHWRECLVCKKFADQGFWEQFMFQNWHSDGDEDRVCDVCGHDIPYHEIDVEEVKGGKITVELDEAPYRKKIVATAEPEEGYKLKKIHFIKVRDNGTEQEITRRKTSTKGTWWTYMPTYDLKVTAEFVKKK